MRNIYMHENFIAALFWIVVVAVVAYITASIVLFIRDGIKAKKEKRPRKVPITVMFIIAVVLAAIAIAITAFFIMLITAIMRSM